VAQGAFLACVVVVVGCGAGKGAAGPRPAQSPERQSEAEYDVARDLFYKGNARAALDHAKRATELDSDNYKAQYFTSTLYLSFCSAEQGLSSPDCRLADAEGHARKAIAAEENFRDARNLLGNVLILQKRYKEAIEVLQPLTKDPAYTETHLAWGNLGWAQVLGGAVDEGIASLKNSITQPKFCVGHYRLGAAYEKKGDLRSAETSLTNALSVDHPDCQNLQDAWELRARVRMKLGKADGGRADLEKCREIAAETSAGKACAQMLGAKAAPGGTP